MTILPLLLPPATILGMCVINMIQTVNISERFLKKPVDKHGNHEIMQQYLNVPMVDGTTTASAPNGKSSDDVIQDLKKLKRNELLTLFLHCDDVTDSSLKEIQGNWDGILLDNNGIVMTYVSSFLTNYLFGKGQDWKGKKIYAGKERLGINRFQSKKDISRGKLQHNFNYEITPSNLAKGKVKSLRLTYVISQNFPSLWSTMNDELRFLRVPSKTGNSCHGILIGIGSMAWSGGVWNGSPFCLWNRSDI